ncbi:exosortase F system-associated membrane protein [Formosa sp. S-31]|uniref:exosortase F system-associated membrane protein n=1 Tax=Formosa sp. S-31 TaxID=2790949 RepID=UPI003EBE72A8
MRKINKWFVVFICVSGLVLIRTFESELFYDPFIAFFKADYLEEEPPHFITLKLMLFTAFRYVLNTVFSLLILKVLFGIKEVVMFSVLLFGSLFVILFPVFLYLVLHPNPEHYYLLFNIRRFLIQPILLLLLLPAFYYNKRLIEKS